MRSGQLSASFITSVYDYRKVPSGNTRAVAIAGRSNVGKSTLINCITEGKKVAKVSATPGKTQALNFFMADDKFHLVDLPGYGYAKVPAAVQKKWGPMIETYLSQRDTLKGVVEIIDIRRVPGKEERNLLDWLSHYHIPCILVVTKADKLSKTKQRGQEKVIAEALSVDREALILFSAKSRQGKDAVWQAVERLLSG